MPALTQPMQGAGGTIQVGSPVLSAGNDSGRPCSRTVSRAGRMGAGPRVIPPRKPDPTAIRSPRPLWPCRSCFNFRWYMSWEKKGTCIVIIWYLMIEGHMPTVRELHVRFLIISALHGYAADQCIKPLEVRSVEIRQRNNEQRVERGFFHPDSWKLDGQSFQHIYHLACVI